MTKGIKDKVVVITGASSGLGAAAARMLSQEGATVVLAARRIDRIQALADQLVAAGRAALALATDVTSRDEVKRLVDSTVDRYGRVDVLINNAGIMPVAPLERLKVGEWDSTIDINLKGVLYGVAAALPHMKQQKSGHLVFVSSVAGHKVAPGMVVYAATKHAIRALAEGVRQELRHFNIRTTVISPGAVRTELLDGISEPDIADAVRKRVEPVALPAESFARAVVFALSQPEEMDVNEILFRPTRQEL